MDNENAYADTLNVYKTNYMPMFESFCETYDYEEVGISFDGETRIDDEMSVITKKDVKLSSPEEARQTYLKVMEVRELTKEEQDKVNGNKKVLKVIFDSLFNGRMWQVVWGAFVGSNLLVELYQGDFLRATISLVCLLVVLSPIKCYKAFKKYFNCEDELLKLQEYLHEKRVSGYVNAIDNDDDIKLYVKYMPKREQV